MVFSVNSRTAVNRQCQVHFCWFRCFSGGFDIQHRLSAWRPQRSAGSGRCDTALWLITREENDFVMMEVADEGPGIPSAVQARMFEPFYTTKEIGTGTGLGLDIVYRIVKGHNGTIEARFEPGHTRFIVRLLLSQGDSAGTAKGA